MKSPVKFVRKKLDNAIEIMCTLRFSIETMIFAKLDKWNSSFVTSSRADREKKQSSTRKKVNRTDFILDQTPLDPAKPAKSLSLLIENWPDQF